MFGRRRRAQVPASPPTPSSNVGLSPDEVYDLVNRKVLDALGPDGRYSLVLRSAADTDAIFSQLAARSLSLAITRSLVGTDTAAHVPTHGKATAAEYARREHAAIAVWADPLRHDPDSVDPAIVSPSTGGLQARGGDRSAAAS